MDALESTSNGKTRNPKSDQKINFESLTINPMISLDTSITKVTKSLCKIIIPKRLSSGFLIKLFKKKEDFFCLIASEHVINREMIEQRKTIDIYYDSEDKLVEIQLNPEERFIKDFRDETIDATVIEILPKDNIPKDYFLLPLIDYMDNYNKLVGKDISIIQYPKGKLNYSFGKIIGLTQSETLKYEFSHDASTDEGSSGSPIFLKGTTKVLGIHKGFISSQQKKENNGDFIWPIFSYFKNFSDDTFESNETIYFNSEPINIINEEKKLDNTNSNIGSISNVINNINEKNNGVQIQNNLNIDKQNQMTIIYGIPKNGDSIKLFGEIFVENNINNCCLFIDDQQTKLTEYLTLNQSQKTKKILEIKLIETNNIINMSNMFDNCNFLITLPDISDWDTKNVTNMSGMFSGCESLESLPDISKWDTKNVTNMSFMFFKCNKLKYLPDISEWETQNVNDMNRMFFKCSSLKSLPDISKWNTKNVINMSGMFYLCSSLHNLPDISKWELNEKLKKEDMFDYCDEKIVPEKFRETCLIL